MLEAVDRLRGDAGLLGQFTDTQPAAGPELLEKCLERPSEKPHERDNLFTIRRLIAT